MFSSVWFEATHVGHDDIVCAEYCGGRSTGPGGELPYEHSDDPRNPFPPGQATGHWAMHSMSFVETDDDYQKFLKSIGDKCDQYLAQGKPCPTDIAAEQGQRIYGNKGCLACHTTTGAAGIGPSWKGIWGKKESTNVGEVTVDENYIRESILDPQAKIVKGFGPVMPTFRGQITDPEIGEVTAYIQSLK
jgi:cytochrome c oxidase subunit 2